MLDPQISLGVRSPEPIDVSKWAQLRVLAMKPEQIQQEIEASKTAQRAQEAQIPGLQALSQQQQFEAQKQADIKDIFSRHSKLDEDNNPVVNWSKAMTDVARAGYGKDAMSLFANHYANTAAMVTTEEGKRGLRNNLFNDAMSLGEVMNQQSPGSGDKFVASAFAGINQVPELKAVVGGDKRFSLKELAKPSDATFNLGANTDLAAVRQKMVDAKVPESDLAAFDAKYPQFAQGPQPSIPTGAAVKSTMAPGQQIEVDKNKPNSVTSQQARDVFDRYGIPYKQNATYNELASTPAGQQLLQAQVPDKATMNAAAADLQGNALKQGIANNGTVAGNALLQSLPPGLVPSDSLAKAAGKLTGNANWNKFLSAVEAAKADGIPVPTDSIEGGMAAIELHKEHLRGRALNAKSVLRGTPTSQQEVPSVKPTGEIPRAAASPAQTVTQSQIEDYAKRARKTVDQVKKELEAKGIKVQ